MAVAEAVVVTQSATRTNETRRRNMLGKIVEGISDKFLPEPVGDILSGAANLLTGNIGGAIDDGVDLFSGSSGASDGVDREPSQSDLDLLDKGIKPDWMDEKQFQAHMLQKAMDERAMMVNLATNLAKRHHESMMAIVSNMRG
jgi:hypothetical protein